MNLLAERKSEGTSWDEARAHWQAEAHKRTQALTPIPPDRWPPMFKDKLLQAWESYAYLVRLFEAPAFNGKPCQQFSVCRYPAIVAGPWEGFVWEDPLSWEELMLCKRQAGFADRQAVEIYPPDRDAVNLSNTRHLWMPAEPLAIGWSLT